MEHRELQAYGGQQGLETLPYKPGPPTGLREGLARAQEAGGPEFHPQGSLPAERVGRAVEAPPGRTPAVGARRARAAGREEPEAATDVGRQRDAPRQVHRASEGRRWWGAVHNLPERVRIADAPPWGERARGRRRGPRRHCPQRPLALVSTGVIRQLCHPDLLDSLHNTTWAAFGSATLSLKTFFPPLKEMTLFSQR